MKRNTIVVAIIVVAVFVLGGIYLVGRRGGTAPSVPTNGLVGKPVPAFSLRDINGVEYSSASLRGKKVVLFFNEGIMCYPACWNQMIALATDKRFGGPDVATFSVVTNQPSDWQSAIPKMPDLGKATVLFDTSKSVSEAFGMLTMSSSMHYGSYPGHSFVVIDREGVVRYVFDDPNMGIDNDRVFAELEKLN